MRCAMKSAPIAHAGVVGRAEFLRALELDPEMADATAGVGLYNYYIDTLSAIARMLRFFMGLPGGNKQEGIRQMRVGNRARRVDVGRFEFLSREESPHV